MALGGMTGMGSTDPRAVASTAPTGYNPAYGGIPNLPAYTTDTQSTVGTDVQAQMLANLPGYQQMLFGDVGNIQRNLAGQVSPDVINLMQQQAAERGIATGMPGAPAGDAAYLRALGLTSLQLQQLGHTQLNEAMARTPIQQQQTTTTTHDTGVERAIYAAAPNPQAAAEQAIRNAQMGMSAGANAAGANRGGYTLNPAAPTQAMGYKAPEQDPLAAAYAWQNAWNASHAGQYTPESNIGLTPGVSSYYPGALYPDIGYEPRGTTYNPSTDQSMAPGFGPSAYSDYGYSMPYEMSAAEAIDPWSFYWPEAFE